MKKTVTVLLAIVFILTCICPGAAAPGRTSGNLPAQELRIMSVNICFDQDNIDERGPKLTEMLLSYEPDSIGTQENGLVGPSKWAGIFEETLTGYSRVGYAADGTFEALDSPANFIYYRTDRYKCIDWDTISLNGFARKLFDWHTCTWAVLEDKTTGFKYAHINTHLDYADPELRHRQMELVADIVKRFEMTGLPVFASGDYNTSEGSDTYLLMTSKEGIDDPKYLAEKTMYSGSYRGWTHRDLSGGKPIDYIFVTGDRMEVSEYAIVDTWADGIPLTDHCAVYVRATVKSLQDAYSAGDVTVPKDGIRISNMSVRSYVFELEVAEPEEPEKYYDYIAELFDSAGRLLETRHIDPWSLDAVMNYPLLCTFGGLEPGTRYSVTFRARNIAGVESSPFVFEFTTEPAS